MTKDVASPRASVQTYDPQVAAGLRRAQLAAERRSRMPHQLFRRGFDPMRQIVSPSKRSAGRRDILSSAHARLEEAAKRGPAAFRPDGGGTFPGMDTVRVAILRVDFLNDRNGSASTGDGRFELQPRDTLNRPLDPTPHDKAFFTSHGEALRRYFDAQSAGRTVMEFTVFPTENDSAFHLTDMADHGPWKFSTEIYEAALKLMNDCLIAADTTESIPWGAFDRVIVVHAGSDLQSDVNQDSPLDIPTFTIGIPDSDAVALGPAKTDTVFAVIIAPESIRQDGFEGTINAVYAHEMGHLVYGWRDVYDVVSGLPTVGYWSLMDTGNLLGNAVTFPNGSSAYAVGILPPSIDPYQKRLIYDDVPTAPIANWGSEDAVPNSAQGYQVLRVPISGEEYLLLENRLDDLNDNDVLTLTRDPDTGVILGPAVEDALEYDYLVPGPGMLAWHVDESVADFFTPGPRHEEFFALNAKRDRFGLQIIEADGLDDLGDFNSPFALGWATDPWFVGNATRLNATSVPKLLTNSNTDPHLDIEFTSPPGPEMTVRVTRLWDRPGWPVVAKQPEGGIVPLVGVVGTGTPTAVAWTGGDSALHVRRLDGSSFIGGPDNDVVFSVGRPLGTVARIESQGAAGPYLAVAEKDLARLHLVRFPGGPPTVETVSFPAKITAGPVSDFRDWMFVGLADGTIHQVLTETGTAETHECGSIGSGEVTGIATLRTESPDGVLAAAAGRTATLWTGLFDPDDVNAAETWSRDVLAPGHAQQPLLFHQTEFADPVTQPIARVAVVDRTVGALVTADAMTDDPAPIEAAQGRALGEPVNAPALGDPDRDGVAEVLFTTESGRVGYWNLNGTTSPGWPPEVELEGFPTRAGPLLVNLPGQGDAPSVLASLGNGLLTVLDPKQKPAPGFPLGTSVFARGTPALHGPDLQAGLSAPTLVVAGGDTLLYAISLGDTAQGGGGSTWSHEGGTPGRAYATATPFGYTGPSSASGEPIVAHSLKLYPNPARQAPITFAFQLDRPATVKVRIFDSAAREVDSFERAGSTSDNAIQWDPAGRTSGLYVARIEVEGQVVTAPFAIVR